MLKIESNVTCQFDLEIDDDDFISWLQAKAPLHLNLFKASTFNPLRSLSSTEDIDTKTHKEKLYGLTNWLYRNRALKQTQEMEKRGNTIKIY